MLPVRRRWTIGLLCPLLSIACEVEEWRNADLQLDITGAELDSEDIIRICIDGTGSRDAALGAGRVAFPGIPATGTVTVTVDALAPGTDSGDSADSGDGAESVRLGRVGPVDFTATGYIEQAWQPCEGDCSPCRQATVGVDDADSRLLAVRFVGLD
ncbi:MAG: hypothetical protein D6798_18400 [Deltaproteobacteria bacterium]|nr:MAG: hypothetical protein D6798_18400 [Deltaproteobacteria bacterium]